MALGVDIISAFDGKGIKKAIEEFKKLETNGQRAQFAIQKAAIPATAALAGLAVAAGLAVKAAVADQQEQAKLAQTLKQVAGATGQAIKQNEKYLASLQRTTIFSDSEMRPALANLVQANGDLVRSQEDLRLAMDISVATGIPLIAVTDALGKAYNGNFKSLKALSPAISDNIKEGQTLDQVFGELSATFGGATAAATNTAAGQMTLLRNQLAELSESFGTALLPIVQAIVPVFASLANFAENNRTAFLLLAGVIATLSTALIAAAGAIKVYNLYKQLMAIETIKTTLALKNAEGALTGFGRAASMVGKTLSVLALAEVIFAIGNSASGANRKIDEAANGIIISIGKMASASAADTQSVVEDFTHLAKEIQGKLTMGDVFGEFGREFQLTMGGALVDIEHFDEAFKKTMDTSPAAAQKLVDALKAQLAITDPTSRAYDDLSDAIARYESQLVQTEAAQATLNRGFGQTLTLAQVARQAFLNVTQSKFDDMRMNTANAETLKQYQTQVLGLTISTKGSADAIKTATERLADYTAALRGNYDAQRAATSATNDRIRAGQSLDSAIVATTKAQDYFNKVTRGFAKDSREAVAATERYNDAQERLRDTNLRLRDATLNQQKAEKQLRDLRALAADPESVAGAERNLERAKFGVEEANFAVIDAETRLAELRAGGASATEIRRAEISLAEAKFAVAESLIDVRGAEASLAEERDRRASPEELAAAERELEDANIQVERATRDVARATEEATIQQGLLNEVLNGATTETEAYQEALKDLNIAKENEATARINNAKAILAEAEAAIALREAQRGLGKLRKTTPTDIISKATEALAGVATGNPAPAALNTSAAPSSTTMNVTVNAGMGADGQSVAREIIDVLKQYERANGFIPLVAESSSY